MLSHKRAPKGGKSKRYWCGGGKLVKKIKRSWRQPGFEKYRNQLTRNLGRRRKKQPGRRVKNGVVQGLREFNSGEGQNTNRKERIQGFGLRVRSLQKRSRKEGNDLLQGTHLEKEEHIMQKCRRNDHAGQVRKERTSRLLWQRPARFTRPN